MKDDNDTGHNPEGHFEYPQEIHDLHKDYPMAPEVLSINETDYQMSKNILANTAPLAPKQRPEDKEVSVKS